MKIFNLFFCISVLFFVSSCKKDSYYHDSGTLSSAYNGTIMQYLESKHSQFDSVVKIIKIAKLESVFESDSITFFAPSDSSIRAMITFLNIDLATLGMQPVTKMAQLDSAFWREQIALYIFKGAHSLDDFPQIDYSNISAFSGRVYNSYDGYPMNIGAVYGSANNIQYAGYRQLQISYLSSISTPKDVTTWYTIPVSSVNIHPTNGYVHALRYSIDVLSDLSGVTLAYGLFGFYPQHNINSALTYGIKY